MNQTTLLSGIAVIAIVMSAIAFTADQQPIPGNQQEPHTIPVQEEVVEDVEEDEEEMVVTEEYVNDQQMEETKEPQAANEEITGGETPQNPPISEAANPLEGSNVDVMEYVVQSTDTLGRTIEKQCGVYRLCNGYIECDSIERIEKLPASMAGTCAITVRDMCLQESFNECRYIEEEDRCGWIDSEELTQCIENREL